MPPIGGSPLSWTHFSHSSPSSLSCSPFLFPFTLSILAPLWAPQLLATTPHHHSSPELLYFSFIFPCLKYYPHLSYSLCEHCRALSPARESLSWLYSMNHYHSKSSSPHHLCHLLLTLCILQALSCITCLTSLSDLYHFILETLDSRLTNHRHPFPVAAFSTTWTYHRFRITIVAFQSHGVVITNYPHLWTIVHQHPYLCGHQFTY